MLSTNRCRRPIFFGSILLAASAAGLVAQDWTSSLSPIAPGAFPELKPLRAQYNFGWNGVAAATAEVRLSKTPENQFQLEASGRTIGLARTLWDFEDRYFSLSDAATLQPLEVREVEKIRSRKWTTNMTFSPEGVVSRREEEKGSAVKTKTREFKFPNVLSLNSALLFLHSRPLVDGAVERFVVYPSTAAYLCTVKVVGRERMTLPTGSYDAIKLDVDLNKIGKKRELLPHKKFKKATVWLSDDANRLVLRIETQIFIGTVFAELQSVQFSAKP